MHHDAFTEAFKRNTIKQHYANIITYNANDTCTYNIRDVYYIPYNSWPGWCNILYYERLQ